MHEIRAIEGGKVIDKAEGANPPELAQKVGDLSKKAAAADTVSEV